MSVKKLLNVVKALGYMTAKGAVNSTSSYYLNQPKEPKDLAKRLAKMGK